MDGYSCVPVKLDLPKKSVAKFDPHAVVCQLLFYRMVKLLSEKIGERTFQSKGAT